MRPLGVYIHYPWCRIRCPYCDFAIAVAPEPDIPHDGYLAAVVGELAARARDLPGRALASIYLGGGTPSLWRPGCIAAAVAAARAAVPGEPAEVTLEANPTDCTRERLAAWRDAGITRVSIGVQSFDDEVLAALGRDHRHGDGEAAIERALAAGFASVSADFILGTPGAGDAGLASVARAVELGVPHLSVYELTIEPRTTFGARLRRGTLVPRDEEEQATLYEGAHHALADAGYLHYEISSYARPGHRAVHNSLYWSGAEYLGVGSGAASFLRDAADGGTRSTNHRSVKRYLAAWAAGDDLVAERRRLDAGELAADRIWLGMRTSDGVPAELLAARPDLIAWLAAHGLAERAGDRVRPTLRGLLMADQVARRLVCSDPERWPI